VCGIIGVPLFFFPVPAALAVVLGVIGHRKARDLGGEIMAVIAATVGVVVLVVFGVLLTRNLYDITHAASTSNIRVGTCLKEVYPERDVVRKDCSARHGSEVVGIVQHPAPPGAAYPAGFELNFQANDLCRSPFADYVGAPYEQSPSAEGFVAYPTEAEWRRGDRLSSASLSASRQCRSSDPCAGPPERVSKYPTADGIRGERRSVGPGASPAPGRSRRLTYPVPARAER
jgi:hypothetical protein